MIKGTVLTDSASLSQQNRPHCDTEQGGNGSTDFSSQAKPSPRSSFAESAEPSPLNTEQGGAGSTDFSSQAKPAPDG